VGVISCGILFSSFTRSLYKSLGKSSEWTPHRSSNRTEVKTCDFISPLPKMSVYYGNLLSANLPNQENFEAHKFPTDPNFYQSSVTPSPSSYDNDSHRYHGYDRAELPKQPYHSFPSPAVPTPGNTYGHFTSSDEGCSPVHKLPESAAAAVMVSSAAGAVGPNQMMYSTNGLASMVNSMGSHHPSHPPSQNLPIYPWMRPLSGGKLIVAVLHH
jgi:hypothetical protein